MTKKDFEVIAEAIRSSTLWWISGHLGWTLAKEMADELEKTNPRFDRSKFIRACTPAGMDGSYIDLSNGSDSLIKKRGILANDFFERGMDS